MILFKHLSREAVHNMNFTYAAKWNQLTLHISISIIKYLAMPLVASLNTAGENRRNMLLLARTCFPQPTFSAASNLKMGKSSQVATQHLIKRICQHIMLA